MNPLPPDAESARRFRDGHAAFDNGHHDDPVLVRIRHGPSWRDQRWKRCRDTCVNDLLTSDTVTPTIHSKAPPEGRTLLCPWYRAVSARAPSGTCCRLWAASAPCPALAVARAGQLGRYLLVATDDTHWPWFGKPNASHKPFLQSALVGETGDTVRS